MQYDIKNVSDEFKQFVNENDKETVLKKVYLLCMDACLDLFLANELKTCMDFLSNKISISQARKHAFDCHEYARNLLAPAEIAFARACGHAIATIHVKEHALACYGYFLKYIRLSEIKLI